MKTMGIWVIFCVIILIAGAIIFQNYQLKRNNEDFDYVENNEPELNINPDNENEEEKNSMDDEEINMNGHKSNEKNNITIKTDTEKNYTNIDSTKQTDNINSKIKLTKKSTFIKTLVGNSLVELEVPETTNAQLSFIVDDCNIDSGYAFIILSKNGTTYGAECWESIYFWKQNEIICDFMHETSSNIEMKPGIYDLFILSNFGKWGLIIKTSLEGEEYEYETPIRNDILFEAIEYGQDENDKTQFAKEIRFEDTYFNIKSSGMLFRFEYIKADMDGYGIESIEINCELYDPNGESVGGSGSESRSYYNNNDYIMTGFSWDRIYAETGKWTGSGNCTIKTWGKPNTDSFDIHMFEFIIYF